MAVPKNKISKARGRSRMANWKLTKPNFAKCPQCQAFRMPHRICGECGYYNGKEIIKKEA